MRSYFFGDIHGNGYALERVLAHLDEVGPDRIYCLGDVVGWLPFGDRSWRRMRALNIPTVAGNHDLLVAGCFTDDPKQLDRIQATAFNAGLLATYPGAIDNLSSLPLSIEGEDFTVVHHSPFDLPGPGQTPTIGCFAYLDDTALLRSVEPWRHHPKPLIFSGHDHLPAVFELADDGELDVASYRPTAAHSLTVPLQPRHRYWIKVGSVGGPYRDQVAVANSALYDHDAQTVTLYRLPYPTQALHQELRSQRFLGNLATIQRYQRLLEQASPWTELT
jgi:predicted phosphodiesterase